METAVQVGGARMLVVLAKLALAQRLGGSRADASGDGICGAHPYAAARRGDGFVPLHAGFLARDRGAVWTDAARQHSGMAGGADGANGLYDRQSAFEGRAARLLRGVGQPASD